MEVKSLNKGLQVQEANVDAMINELAEREEFSGGGGGSCTGITCEGPFTF